MKSKFVLASGSPRRRELLSQIGIRFSVKVSNADEDIEEANPKELVKK
ncbi:MAG: Maf family protein, partial [Lachnospiraceae bacterium]